MTQTFEKENIWIEWVPITILIVLSLFFMASAITIRTPVFIVASLIAAGMFALFPIFLLHYLNSFKRIEVSGNTIRVWYKNDASDFRIPDNLGRVKLSADDVEIELLNERQRFVVRSHFLKNKGDFHKLFDQIIRDHPPSKDKVILKASVLEIMDRQK
jgi:hypothetical protein